MRRIIVALIARSEGDTYELFPYVDSADLSPIYDDELVDDAAKNQECREAWKRRIRHYAAAEGWTGVFFASFTEHNYLRVFGFDKELFPEGDDNYVFFPVRSEADASEEDPKETLAPPLGTTCDECGKPWKAELIYYDRRWICLSCVGKLAFGIPCGPDAPAGDRTTEEEAFIRCVCCGKAIDWTVQANWTMRSGEPVCRECAKRGAAIKHCTNCGEPFDAMGRDPRSVFYNLCPKCCLLPRP